MSLLVAIGFCAKDRDRLFDLLTWCGQLGRQEQPCLLVADPDVLWVDGQRAIDLAEKAFGSVEMVALDMHVDGWTAGSVALFRKSAMEAKRWGLPWLWLEPDGVPLKAGWASILERAYRDSGKDFMGAMVNHQQPGLPSPYLEGVAVYPADAIEIMGSALRLDQSWTFTCAELVVPFAINTPLIRHVWGEKGLPPTFADNNVPGTNVFCLRQIPDDAVIWHRCKDASLIRLLRKKSGVDVSTTDLMVVLPFCGKDAPMFVKNVRWWGDLDQNTGYTCLLSYERGTPTSLVSQIEAGCRRVFAQVRKHQYDPPPPRGVMVQTYAFTKAAKAVQHNWRGPWLWNEYDSIPLKSRWMGALQMEYLTGGKSFMGPLVPNMGHMNGGAVYPYDTPDRIPKAMRALTHAWDMEMKDEMIHDFHDASKLMQHVWVVDRSGVFQPYGNGTAPSFRDRSLMNQIYPTAVTYHRCKDGTLIDRLREQKHP